MDTTIRIRNLDESTYRELTARAAPSGRTIGELVTAAIRGYLARPSALTKRRSLRDLMGMRLRNARNGSSGHIDAIVYGASRRRR